MNSLASPTEIVVFFHLVLSHILTDFFLQPKKWVDHKRQRQGKSVYLYIHGLLAGVLVYLLVTFWTSIWLIAFIGVSHVCIDYVKIKYDQKGTLNAFLLDQVVHLCFLSVAWLLLVKKTDFTIVLTNIYTNRKIMAVGTGYLVCTLPLSFLIAIATRKWQPEVQGIPETTQTSANLLNAGKWIGILERLLIFTFVLLKQYEAIGLLIAAKSLLRFKPGDGESKQSEYVLIGTLLSYCSAIFTGIIINFLLS